MDKVPNFKLKKAAKEKLLEQYGIAIGGFLLMAVILFGLLILIAIALSGTLLAPIISQIMENVTDMDSLLQVEEDMINMLNTPKYILMSDVVSGVMGALSATLLTGFMRICLMIARSEKPTIGDLFYVYKHNPDKVILLYLAVFVIQLILNVPSDIMLYFLNRNPGNGALSFASSTVSLVFSIAAYIVSLYTSMVYYLYLDDCEESVPEILKQSIRMMKGNSFRLFALEVSFLGWLILTVFTLGVLSIWAIPYLETSIAEFYRNLKGEDLWISTQNYQTN